MGNAACGSCPRLIVKYEVCSLQSGTGPITNIIVYKYHKAEGKSFRVKKVSRILTY